jgi:predicted HicB family RNase H-like nuclease
MTYKGYTASIEYSEENECLVGRISDIRQPIDFRGDSVKDIRQSFEKAVDSYLDHCAERNQDPEKPSAGRSVVRVSPALYSVIALAAKKEKKSVSTWMAEVCKKPGKKEE